MSMYFKIPSEVYTVDFVISDLWKEHFYLKVLSFNAVLTVCTFYTIHRGSTVLKG